MFNKKEYMKQYGKQYRKNNQEKEKERKKQWYKNNPEKTKNSHKRWDDNNLGERSKISKQWAKDNPEKIKRSKIKFQKDNPDYLKQWHKDNPDYYKNNRERLLKRNKEFMKTEKGKACAQRKNFNRITKMKEIINNLTAQEWINILKEYKFRCAYCGCEFTLFNKETRDHVIPISKGGGNIKGNIVPACRSCNSKKNNKITNEEVKR